MKRQWWMLGFALLIGFVCSELLAVTPVDPQAPEYGTAAGPEIENDISRIPVFTPATEQIRIGASNCDHTRPRCPETEVASTAGRFQIHGDYRLDTATGEIVRIQDVLHKQVVEARKATLTNAATKIDILVGGEIIHQIDTQQGTFAVIDLTEAVMIWFERLIRSRVAVPV